MLNSVKINREVSSNILKTRIWKGLGLSMLVFLFGAAEAPVTAESEKFSLEKRADQILSENKACIAVDDGCITCALKGRELVCSTPRTACIPHELKCTLTSMGQIDGATYK
ncbi:hypothetical protein Q5698_12645 [Brucella intermedia]|uniref:hypothetical protein n=1 Tax=Brucella intermedia TaxID=94625 RepID=UPI00273236DA|nr:hypothetical protein [Brucella intermedia]WLF96466.1 hypothetical protein Q5698_12645 [Brucella intermedia]